ncbi:hypothetical protein [Methylocystis heyeri]|uniref:Secreted protein n=1 Tax=Methylocystis heyeri TaxID=391905 RepID=A0A6B8KB31_9HYPH|nr:hypothetical protein [Methylocystis heyeri]QGM45326.1 hypothetical protein H2LOC_006230 [Methylocystis heyeri]
MTARALTACLLFLAAATTAAAQTAGAGETAQKPVAAFGDDNPDCPNWGDGCVVCSRQPDGAVACSTPGIACLPGEPTCGRGRRRNP